MTLQTRLESHDELLRDDLQSVERALREATRSIAPLIAQVGEHTFSSGGKRIRPALVLLAARLCGYRGPRAIQVAAATEMLHTATLLHDDVVDGAVTRRGRPSVNKQFGDGVAVLVGDFLLARASQTIVEDGDYDLLRGFAETIRAMSEGELLQISRSFDPEESESVYLEVIGRKTSSLLALCTEGGAIVGGVTRAERRAVRDFGWELGLAFQLVDDALDYSGREEALGKAPLTDLAEGKVTLPLIATLKRCTVAERESIASTLKSLVKRRLEEPDADVPAAAFGPVPELVERYRGADTALDRAQQRVDRAVTAIQDFADCDAKRALGEIARFVVQRES